MPKIALIDDSITIVNILSDLLTANGYQVFGLTDPRDALEEIVFNRPDLIILDVIMPGINGYDLCRVLRNDTRTSHLPVLLLTSRSDIVDKVAGLEAGADDYIVKPFEPAEVLARVRTHLRRATQQKCFSPLTGLPGNVIIEAEIKKRLLQPDSTFAVLYLDLDNFKSYNDTYGFVKGDELLRTTANIFRNCIQRQSPLQSFVGHVGGDDFIAIVTVEVMHQVCRSVITEFDATVGSFYNEADLNRGYIVARDRQGKVRHFPLVTVSIAAISGKQQKLTDILQIGELAASLKRRAKEHRCSIYVSNE